MEKTASKSTFQQLTAGLVAVLALMLFEAAAMTVFTIINVRRSSKMAELNREIIVSSSILDRADDCITYLETSEPLRYEKAYNDLEEQLASMEKLLDGSLANAKDIGQAHAQFNQMNILAKQIFNAAKTGARD